ncbi:selenium-dependent molybdenum cofactor biosynthesis protein YqeB [Dongshaea marina]|uniref:selenium-dependent molybdenum cofactor biosynthesis protein YqeB n=1 Tax=Dongshaea marina TaxID=2047966 RepID=UPI001F379C21|nr:selenium-dependent molybdenum cofactor biosynthesis protein YqeB [Dongshaea marina]
MKVFIDVCSCRPTLILVGAGHVNRCVASLAHQTGFALKVLDTHPASLNPENYPEGCVLIHGQTMVEALDKVQITPQDYVIIATNHEDYCALEHLIDCDCRYLGLLASKRKVRHFRNQLREQGYNQQQLQRWHSPVGLDIGAETPAEIAVSVVAELLKIQHKRPGSVLAEDVRVNPDKLVIIRGAGDLASGVALRLHRAGFKVVMLECEHPTVIRRTVAFASAVFEKTSCVEGIRARLVDSPAQAFEALENQEIPVFIDPDGILISKLKPHFVIDAILAKKNCGTHKKMAPVTLALGPGFKAPEDVSGVIETQRGHHLGQVIYQGSAQEDTGVPGNILGFTHQRVVRSPIAGTITPCVEIGTVVKEGDCIANIGDCRVIAPISGMVRGMIQPGSAVSKDFKIADIDPRGEKADYTTVSDKARAISGGVLEAMLNLAQN